MSNVAKQQNKKHDLTSKKSKKPLCKHTEDALDQYFTLRIIASPYSMFRRIRKLPPAHFLTYSAASGVKVGWCQ